MAGMVLMAAYGRTRLMALHETIVAQYDGRIQARSEVITNDSNNNAVVDLSQSVASRLLYNRKYAGAVMDYMGYEAPEVPQLPGRVLDGRTGVIFSLIQLPDGRVCSATTCITLWDPVTGNLDGNLYGHTEDVYMITYLPKHKKICSIAGDGTMRFWDLATEDVITIEFRIRWGTEWRRLSDGRYCTGLDNGNIEIGKEDAVDITLVGHTGQVCSVIELSDGRVCSCSRDRTVRIWNIATETCEVLTGHTLDVVCLVQLADGRLCSGSNDNTIRVWNASTHECEKVLTGHTDQVTCLIQLADGRLCSSSGDSDGTIRIWPSSDVF
jgi:WD40 repeat protein